MDNFPRPPYPSPNPSTQNKQFDDGALPVRSGQDDIVQAVGESDSRLVDEGQLNRCPGLDKRDILGLDEAHGYRVDLDLQASPREVGGNGNVHLVSGGRVGVGQVDDGCAGGRGWGGSVDRNSRGRGGDSYGRGKC